METRLGITGLVAVILGLSSVSAAGQVLNGEHSFIDGEWDYRPIPLRIGFGENQDASLNLQQARLLSGEGARVADSFGSGTPNTVAIEMDDASQLSFEFDVDGLADVLGYDGTVELNLNGGPTEDGLHPPPVTARAWALSDAETGEVLASFAGDAYRKSASITKAMCALVVIRLIESDPNVLDEVIVFSERASAASGSHTGLTAGEALTVRDALYGLMLPSGNDAGNAIAEHFRDRFDPPDPPVSSTWPERVNFVAEMNRVAAEIGMEDTIYRIPFGDGGGASDHTTTAKNLLLLGRYAFSYPLFRQVVGTSRHTADVILPSGGTRQVTWNNTNQLLARNGYDGIKTGTTATAGACLLSTGTKGPGRIYLAVLGSASSALRYTDSEALYDWAWQHFYDADGVRRPEVAAIGGTIGGNLRTRRVTLAARPESSVTVNLDGPRAIWHARSRHLDIGMRGHAEVNLRNGATLIDTQRVVVGGTRWNDNLFPEAGGTGSLLIDGPGTMALAHFGDTNGLVSVGRRGTGTLTVSNGGRFEASRHPTSGVDLWVGNREGGDGSLLIKSGGVFNADGILRLASNGADRGLARIADTGSALNIFGSTSFVGNTPRGAENPEAIGILEVLNGGAATFETSLRIANQSSSVGEVTVSGPGSRIDLGTFIQVGFNGNGTLRVADGGRIHVPDTSESFSSFGREAGHGDVTIEGTGSELVVPRLFIGSTANLTPTGGSATVRIRNGGHLRIDRAFGVRGGSRIELTGGGITLESDVADFGGNSQLSGHGTFTGDLRISGGAGIRGEDFGISIDGTVAGSGAIERSILGGLNLSPGNPMRLDFVVFKPGAEVSLAINDLEGVENLVTVGNGADFRNADLTITFEPFPPAETWASRIFDVTGTGNPPIAFRSLNLPEGWVLDDGLLRHQSARSLFEQWILSHGLTGPDASPGANPAGDGFSNRDKFAFGLDPTIPATALAALEREPNLLLIRWNRSSASSVSYQLQRISALGTGNWENVPASAPALMSEPDLNPPDGYDRVEWRVDVSQEEQDKSFYRVVAVLDEDALP